MSAQIKLFADNAADGIDAASATANVGDGQDEQALLDELCVQYQTLRDEVAAVVAQRSQQAVQLAQAGADGLRSNIRSAPGTSIALAAIAGGLIAVLATSRRVEPTWREAAQTSARNAAHRAQTSLRSVDIDALADRIRHSAESSFSNARDQASGIVPGLERLAHTISTMDASALTPAIEKGTSWIKSVWDKLPTSTMAK